MNFHINIEELNLLLKNFYTLTHIRIVVFDDSYNEITSFPNHHCEYCRILRKNKQVLEKCILCDREACEGCKATHKTVTYKCHAGMTEAVTPILYENMVVGYVMLGQILEAQNKEELWDSIYFYIKRYDVDTELLKKAFIKKKCIEKEKIIAASKIMQACSGYLYLSKMIALKEDSLSREIDKFINQNLDKKLNVDYLCKRFSISKSLLYKISTHSYGMGIADHIRDLRISLAKELLNSTDKKINEIAEICGYYDYNYFTKVFKKCTGLVPIKYRKWEN